uniref:SUEL-type lectin domain-containing protein n=1 Tax=Oryzias melastigma TaxID=30732 RepID=A0A3B3DBJ2_ORYME
AVSADTAITCESDSTQVLECANGVINIQSAFYGRANMYTCSEGRPTSQLTNTMCSLSGVEDVIKSRCDFRTSCEIDMNDIRTSDPCPGTYKYLQTNFNCLPSSKSHARKEQTELYILLQTPGCVIYVYGAYYGSRDPTTCSGGQTSYMSQYMQCLSPTDLVAQSCNGMQSCTILANDSLFAGVPMKCYGIYKYLETAYVCVCK